MMAQQKTIEQLLCSTRDAAQLLGIGRSKFYQMHSMGELGPIPILLGGKKMWSTDELREWVEKKCPNRDVWLKGGDNDG